MHNAPMCRLCALALCCAISAAPAGSAGAGRAVGGQTAAAFQWPHGKRAAVSLSFDDGRASQMETGLALLKKAGVKVTFFVNPDAVGKKLDAWKQAAADGHEIANHTATHPCTGNYAFSAANALESYTLDKMAGEVDGASAAIENLLGVTPTTFAYPCGQKFVGRDGAVKSYVPLVAARFLVGRGYLDESPNDPALVDLAQAMGTAFDDMGFPQMKAIVDAAAAQGRWIIFVGHDIGRRAHQTTDAAALEQLCAYVKDPANGIWLGTVADIGRYVRGRQLQAQR